MVRCTGALAEVLREVCSLCMWDFVLRCSRHQLAVCKGQQPLLHSQWPYVLLDLAPLLVGWLIIVASRNVAYLWLLDVSVVSGAVLGAVSDAVWSAVSGAISSTISGVVFGAVSIVISVFRVLYQVPSWALYWALYRVSSRVLCRALYRVPSQALCGRCLGCSLGHRVGCCIE